MLCAGFADSVPAAGAGSTPSAADSIADSMNASGGFNTGMGIGQAAAALCNAIGTCIVAGIQADTLDIQGQAIRDQYASQERMVAKDTTMKVEMAQAGEDKIKLQQAGQKEFNKAQEERAKVDGQLSLVKEQKRQIELNEKSAKLHDDRNLSNSFRGAYSQGSPYA